MPSNKLSITLLSLIILIIGSTLFTFVHNQDREIYFEPDDHYSYLVNTTNIKHCKISDCYEKNFFKYKPKKKKEKINLRNTESSATYNYFRQIHRLVLDYTPLYTFILDKSSNLKNIFEVQKNFHLIISFFSAIIIFFYLKNLINSKQLLLISSIAVTHWYLNSFGIQRPIAWSFSAYLGSFAIFLQFRYRFISFIIFLIASLFHPIGLIVTAIGYIVYWIISFQELIIEKKIKIFFLRELKFFLILFLVLYIGFTTKYSAFELTDINIFNIYGENNEWTILNILYHWKLNFLRFFSEFLIPTIILLNPLLFIFFLLSFFIKFSKEIKILKVFTIVYLIFSILFIHKVDIFGVGQRLWTIFVINYLVLSIVCLYVLSKRNKHIKLVKNIFILMLPFFLTINFSQYIQDLNGIKAKENNYYDSKNIEKFRKKIKKNEVIVFDTRETTFYYYLIKGFIRNNIFHKSNEYEHSLNKDIKKKIKYLVIDNPVSLKRLKSDIVLNNTSEIIIDKKLNNFELIFYSNMKSNFEINEINYNIDRGYNNIKFKDNKLKISSVNSNLRLVGFKINNLQKSSWPWGKDIYFEINDSLIDYHKYLFLKTYSKKRNYKFDFNKLKLDIENDFEKCKKSLISDIDSSIIFLVNCDGTL
jgi:hypothetical protein